MSHNVVAYIGLGSNLPGTLGSAKAQLLAAVEKLAALPDSELLAVSPLYQSLAIGPEQPDFTNAVAALKTSLPPLALLDALQAIEQAHQRERVIHWGPRTLDLDLLLYGEQMIDLPRLKVPHPFLTERGFVLYPLADLAPTLTLPDGRSLRELLTRCPPDGLTQLTD